MQGKYRIRLGSKAIGRIKEKVKELTKRSQSISMEHRLRKLNQATQGWVNYFAIADCKKTLEKLDEMIRTRLRMCIWKSWKKISNRIKQLIKLGVEEWKAFPKCQHAEKLLSDSALRNTKPYADQ